MLSIIELVFRPVDDEHLVVVMSGVMTRLARTCTPFLSA